MMNRRSSGRDHSPYREDCIRGKEEFTMRCGPIKPQKQKEPVKFDGKSLQEDFINRFEACKLHN